MKITRIAFFALFCIATAHASTRSGAAATDGIVSHITRVRVPSTAVAAVGYSKRLHALEIEFVNGAIYRYLNVPISVYQSLISADSKARFYDENVRGKYRSVHVKPRRE